MIKVGGKWVDVAALEVAVRAVPGVHDCKIIFGSQHQNAFLVLDPDGHPIHEQPLVLEGAADTKKADNGALWPGVVEAVRHTLPIGCKVHVVAGKAFPRHAATNKVDRD